MAMATTTGSDRPSSAGELVVTTEATYRKIVLRLIPFLGLLLLLAWIDLVNSVGNLAGFTAPYLMGSLMTATGSFSVGLCAVATLQVISTLLVLAFVRREK